MAESIALGSRFTIILGGEPLIRKGDLLKLFRKYARRPFIVATNGILLDEDYAKEVAELGNVITLLDIPGLEATTNKIRGNSTASWSAIKNAAENFSIIRRIALNMLKNEKTYKGIINSKRFKAG